MWSSRKSERESSSSCQSPLPSLDLERPNGTQAGVFLPEVLFFDSQSREHWSVYQPELWGKHTDSYKRWWGRVGHSKFQGQRVLNENPSFVPYHDGEASSHNAQTSFPHLLSGENSTCVNGVVVKTELTYMLIQQLWEKQSITAWTSADPLSYTLKHNSW